MVCSLEKKNIDLTNCFSNFMLMTLILCKSTFSWFDLILFYYFRFVIKNKLGLIQTQLFI